MCHLSLTPRTYWEVISDRQRTGPRESHPSEDLSELPPLRDPATRWFPNVMDYSDLKQGCGWTGVPLCPFPVMAAPGAARFLQAAVTRSYRTGLYARPIMIIRWDLLIMSVYHGAAPESALALRAGKGGCYESDKRYLGCFCLSHSRFCDNFAPLLPPICFLWKTNRKWWCSTPVTK